MWLVKIRVYIDFHKIDREDITKNKVKKSPTIIPAALNYELMDTGKTNTVNYKSYNA